MKVVSNPVRETFNAEESEVVDGPARASHVATSVAPFLDEGFSPASGKSGAVQTVLTS